MVALVSLAWAGAQTTKDKVMLKSVGIFTVILDYLLATQL